MLKNRFIFFTLIILLIINLAVLLNINYLREFSVFLFLMVIPGFVLLRILNIKNLDFWEKLVLTIGISISTTIFLGLFVNYFFTIFNLKPLTSINLLLSYDFLIISLLIIILIKSHKTEVTTLNYPLKNFLLKLNSYDKFALILSIIIPTLSIFGSNIVVTNTNPINILFMVMIIGLISYLVIFYKKINNNLLPVTILSIGISILLAFSLFTPYIYGSDSNNEFHFFQLVLINSKWAIFENSVLDSSVSISILPAIYQILSNLNPNYAFKLSFIVPLSITPLIVYLITRKYVKNDIFAFLAAIFIISQSTFFSEISAYRNYIAIFFFALVIMIIVKDKMNYKWVSLYIIFLFSAILSHYTTAYVILAILLLSFIIADLIQLFLKFISKDSNKHNLQKDKNFIGFGIIILISAFIFFWDGQIANQSFNAGVNLISNSINNLKNFSNMDSSVFSMAAGATLKNAPLSSYINFFTYWISIVFIISGVLTCLITYLKKPNYYMKLNFLSLSLSSITLFGLMLILPGIFISLSSGRVYSQILVILSCFFVLGCINLTKKIKIKKPELIIVLIIVLSFFTTSGLSSQFAGSPNSILFNTPEKINDNFFIYDTEAYAATWFKNNHVNNNIYADTPASDRLISIGLVPFSRISTESISSNTTLGNGYLYLDYSNIIEGEYNVWGRSGWSLYNMSNFQKYYENKNLIYNSGESQIWDN